MLTEEPFGICNCGDFERVQSNERLGWVLFLISVLVFIENGQARNGLHELIAFVAAVVSDGRLGRVDGVGPGMGEQGSILIDLLGLTAILLILSGCAIRAMAWIRNLVEAVIDDFPLGKMGEETPCNNLGSIGACLVDALVLGGGTVVPLERPEVTVVVSMLYGLSSSLAQKGN